MWFRTELSFSLVTTEKSSLFISMIYISTMVEGKTQPVIVILPKENGHPV